MIAALRSRFRGISRDLIERYRLRHANAVLVSYPKSGRTFVRVMLARLFQRQFGIDEREVLRFSTLRRAGPEVPKLQFTHAVDAMRGTSRVKVDLGLYAGKKVAILARHPGDVAVSRYYHLRERSRDPARRKLAERPLETFVWTERGGIPTVVEYLNQWAKAARARGDLHVARFEDFLSDPERTLTEMASFLGLDASQEAIRDAVEFARLENMRAREREGYFSSGRLGARQEGDKGFKVRSGRSGGYRAQLSEEGVWRVDDYVRARLDPLYGYCADEKGGAPSVRPASTNSTSR